MCIHSVESIRLHVDLVVLSKRGWTVARSEGQHDFHLATLERNQCDNGA